MIAWVLSSLVGVLLGFGREMEKIHVMLFPFIPPLCYSSSEAFDYSIDWS